MAKSSKNLASMSVDALLKLRDDIGAMLSKKAAELKHQLSQLMGMGGHGVGKTRKSSKKRRAVAAKYRHPKTGRTWSGRGATLKEIAEDVKAGAKLEDFLIATPAVPSRKKPAAKRSRKQKSA